MTNIHHAYLAPLRPHRVVVAEVIGLPRWRHRKVLWVAPRVARPWWVALQQCQAGRTHLSAEGDTDAVFNPCAGYVCKILLLLGYTMIYPNHPRSTWAWWSKLMNMVKTGQIPFHDLLAPVPGLTAWHLQSLGRKNLLGCQLLDDMNWYDNIWLIYDRS